MPLQARYTCLEANTHENELPTVMKLLAHDHLTNSQIPYNRDTCKLLVNNKNNEESTDDWAMEHGGDITQNDSHLPK